MQKQQKTSSSTALFAAAVILMIVGVGTRNSAIILLGVTLAAMTAKKFKQKPGQASARRSSDDSDTVQSLKELYQERAGQAKARNAANVRPPQSGMADSDFSRTPSARNRTMNRQAEAQSRESRTYTVPAAAPYKRPAVKSRQEFLEAGKENRREQWKSLYEAGLVEHDEYMEKTRGL